MAKSQECQRIRHVRRSFFKRNATLIGFFVVSLIFLGSYYFFSSTISPSSVVEDAIDRRLKSLQISKAEEEEWLDSHKSSNVLPKRVLLVGLIASVRELYENDSVVESISKLCWAYQAKSGLHVDSSQTTIHEGFVELNMLYQTDGSDDPSSFIGPLSEKLHSAGCKTSFIRDDHVLRQPDLDHNERAMSRKQSPSSRYRKLARLRSVQRRHILDEHSSGDYDVVVNVDLDIEQFPSLHAMITAIERSSQDVETGSGSVVCANGYETWTMLSSIQRHLYYDTFAAIDINGVWYYTKYASDLWQAITFGQTSLFRNILQQHPDLWAMQTCFGGLAMYDYPSWANKDCDYEEQNIRLKASTDTPATAPRLRGLPVFEQQMRQFHNDIMRQSHWRVPLKYTMDHTPNGDVSEHVVFQQCLLASSRARNAPSPKVGIQPNLLIGREISILSKWEDKMNLLRKIVAIFVLLSILSMLVHSLRERLAQGLRDSSTTSSHLKRRNSYAHCHHA